MSNLKFRYERTTQTVRTEPENYCVVALKCFTQGGHTDAAIKSTPDQLGTMFALAPELLSLCRDLSKEFEERGFGAGATDLDDMAVELKLLLNKTRPQ